MKKLFAIVLTVAMVLGLATTAFAAWGPSATANDPEKFPTVEVIKYVKHTAAGGSFYYTVDAGAQAINDAQVYYAVKMVVPSLSDTVKALATVEVKAEGLEAGAAAYGKATLTAYGVDAAGTYYMTEAGWKASNNLQVNEYICQAFCRDTDTAKVTATVQAKSPFKTGQMLTKGVWTFANTSETMIEMTKSAWTEKLMFTRDSSTGLVTKVEYLDAVGKAEVILNSDVGNGFTLKAVDGSAKGTEDDDYVKAALAFVGFTMADVKGKVIYMTNDNCIANFGVNLKATSSAAWGAAKDPIILDAVTVIPKTGDVVTIGAAVMTLIAAAGALSLRKH